MSLTTSSSSVSRAFKAFGPAPYAAPATPTPHRGGRYCFKGTDAPAERRQAGVRRVSFPPLPAPLRFLSNNFQILAQRFFVARRGSDPARRRSRGGRPPPLRATPRPVCQGVGRVGASMALMAGALGGASRVHPPHGGGTLYTLVLTRAVSCTVWCPRKAQSRFKSYTYTLFSFMTNKNHDFGVKMKQIVSDVYSHHGSPLALFTRRLHCTQSIDVRNANGRERCHFAGCSGFVRFDAG